MVTVSVGIPAFNEEANIGNLMTGLLRQTQKNFCLKEIIVYSDGSTDSTVKIVRQFKDTRIRAVDQRKREGRAFGQNQIIRNASGKILVLFDADVTIKDRLFLEKIIKPIVEKRADLVSVSLENLPPRNFFEGILAVSMQIKKKAFEQYLGGHNLYTCHGPARAFSQRLYQMISFPQSIGEDAYSFLFCLFFGFRYCYLPQAVAYYRLPDNLADHENQSRRFFSSPALLSGYFGDKFVSRHYFFPWAIFLPSIAGYLLKKPLQTVLYLLILLLLRLKSAFKKLPPSQIWPTAKSSKVLEVNG